MSKLNANSLKRFDAITMIRHYGTVAFGVVMFIVFSVLCKSFCTWDNLMIMLRSMSMLCICALGFTFVMAAGGFDMSIGDASGLVNMIFVYSLISYGNLPLSIVLGLLIGVGVGLLNGVLAGVIGLPDFIATYAVGSITLGIKMLLSKGNPTNIPKDAGLPSLTFAIGQGRVNILGVEVPVPVLVMIVFCILVVFILKKTPLGRRIYAIGGNKVASQYSGPF